MSKPRINIIGAGISGLLAAKLLEDKGLSSVVWEATDRIGGRMKTDILKGYQLDHGFQVLLDEYPQLQKHIDLDALELQKLLPGSLIFENKRSYSWGDPLRNPARFWSSIFNTDFTISDKYRLYQLKNQIEQRSYEEHFKGQSLSTAEFLKEEGFSEQLINNFFKPFFSGIFLEDQLATPASMFKFVYALFSHGNAVIPKAGIEAVPKQLAGKLKHTKFHFNTKVDRVEKGKLIIEGVDEIPSDYTIIATDPVGLLDQLGTESSRWNSTDCLYFEMDKNLFKRPIIGLFPKAEWINHAFYPQSISTQTKGEKELISINVVRKHHEDISTLESKCRADFKQQTNYELGNLLSFYRIKKALPIFDKMAYAATKEESNIMDGIYLAGDQQLNPSQNAALSSAEAAVESILEKTSGLSVKI